MLHLEASSCKYEQLGTTPLKIWDYNRGSDGNFPNLQSNSLKYSSYLENYEPTREKHNTFGSHLSVWYGSIHLNLNEHV